MPKPRNVMKSLRVKDFLNVEGNFTAADLFTSSDAFAVSRESLTGAGALSVVLTVSELTTDSADAFTLADGVEGQLKVIKALDVAAGDGTLTPANFADGSTITFDAANEVAILYFDGTDWQNLYTNATIA